VAKFELPEMTEENIIFF